MIEQMKLSILLENQVNTNKDLVLAKLKASSPQNYWLNQIQTASSSSSADVAASLINTSHEINEQITLPVNPVYPLYSASSFNPLIVDSEINNVPTTLAAPPPSTGQNTPEQVADPDTQNAIKLKILIQQVIQEMAEGTV